MFKISTKGDYGLLLMSMLAEKSGSSETSGTYVSLKEIAHEKHLSLPYLSQIILPLKNAGLVDSKEGRVGGYRLAKRPAEISLMQILEALEGPMSPVRCCSDTDAKCGSEAKCNVKFAWKDAQLMLSEFFKKKTLADILITSPASFDEGTHHRLSGSRARSNAPTHV